MSDIERLVAAARKAAQQAYAPYSQFTVGAALMSVDGQIFTGVNVENASYGLTICAERNALAAAVSAGQRAFSAMAIAAPTPVPPCGACRQVLAEFAPSLVIYLADLAEGTPYVTDLQTLFPTPFTLQKGDPIC